MFLTHPIDTGIRICGWNFIIIGSIVSENLAPYGEKHGSEKNAFKMFLN